MGASAGLILAWILGFLGGAVVMWAFARARANERERATAEARAALGETFAALGADALRHNNESFLALAEQRFARLVDADKWERSPRSAAFRSREDRAMAFGFTRISSWCQVCRSG